MKTWKRILALVGIAAGTASLLLGVLIWLFISRGPFPSGFIHTEHAHIPFIWQGEMTSSDYVIVASLGIFGTALIVASYRFGFRRHSRPEQHSDERS